MVCCNFCTKLFRAHVRVDFCGRDTFMTQELLNDSQIGSAFHKVGRETVS